jgi:biopolymer transport protein ExbB
MHRNLSAGHTTIRATLGLALATLLLTGGADRGTVANPGDEPETVASLDEGTRDIELIGREAMARYRRTPPADRMTWGGLLACAGLGLGVLAERLVRLRQGRIVPREFVTRYLDRLREGKLDRGKALDFCELNPSPAARVALAAVRRWGRPVIDLERAVAMAQRVEVDQLRRNLGTLRRVAAMSPLLGLLGSLLATGRVLAETGTSATGPAWGPALASALTPLTFGVALAILALVAYDGLTGRVEKLAGTLERLGAETVDAIAMASPAEARTSEIRAHAGGHLRSPHAVRVEIPEALSRNRDRDDTLD